MKHRSPTNQITGHGQTGSIIVDAAFHYNSTEWSVLSTEGFLAENVFPCCPDIYQGTNYIYRYYLTSLSSDITFTLKLKRFRFQPVVLYVLPCILTAFLSVLSFFVPPDAGEKIGLNVVVLLAMVVFMDSLSREMPPMQHGIPILFQFFVVSMCIIALSLITTVFCLRLHYRNLD